MKAFADKVKDARISLGMSQTQLAQEVGVSSRSVQAYESGEKKPRQAMMAKLEKALDNDCMFDGSSIDGFVRNSQTKYAWN